MMQLVLFFIKIQEYWFLFRKLSIDSLVLELMSFLDSKLTTDYVKFGYHLGLNMIELHRIEEEVGHDTKRCITKILLHWRNHSHKQDITHEAIVRALQASEYQMLSKIVESHFSSLSFCSMCQRNHGGGNIELAPLNHILCSRQFGKLYRYSTFSLMILFL